MGSHFCFRILTVHRPGASQPSKPFHANLIASRRAGLHAPQASCLDLRGFIKRIGSPACLLDREQGSHLRP
jgi:hypothetical protein